MESSWPASSTEAATTPPPAAAATQQRQTLKRVFARAAGRVSRALFTAVTLFYLAASTRLDSSAPGAGSHRMTSPTGRVSPIRSSEERPTAAGSQRLDSDDDRQDQDSSARLAKTPRHVSTAADDGDVTDLGDGRGQQSHQPPAPPSAAEQVLTYSDEPEEAGSGRRVDDRGRDKDDAATASRLLFWSAASSLTEAEKGSDTAETSRPGLGAWRFAGPAANIHAIPLWQDPQDWGKYAGYSPFSVSQPFTPDLVEKVYGAEALSRAISWAAAGRALWCGTAEDVDGFHVDPHLHNSPGTAHFAGACAQPAAQVLFDQGLTKRYAFNDNEAVCNFKAAALVDPECIMAYLGIAIAAGPNVNYAFVQSSNMLRVIHEALGKASMLLDCHVGDRRVEHARDIFDSLLERYVPDDWSLGELLETDSETAFQAYDAACTQTPHCQQKYAAMMSSLASKYPDNTHIAALAAGALMQAPAWKWWQPGSQYKHPGIDPILAPHSEYGQLHNATRANTLLIDILRNEPQHLGANHYIIHNVEMGPQPNWGLGDGERIAGLSPSDGHILHMATHIFDRLGDHPRAIQGNKEALRCDFEWNLKRSGGGITSVLYKYEPHNTEFIVTAAWDMGNFREAAAAVALLHRMTIFRLSADPPFGSLHSKLARQFQLPLRFGLWERVIEDTAPGSIGCPVDDNGYVTLLHGESLYVPAAHRAKVYARTVALARMHEAEKADIHLAKLISLYNVVSLTKEGVPAHEGVYTWAMRDTVMMPEVSSQRGNYKRHKQPLGLNSAEATGTLTVDNSDGLAQLYLMSGAAEVKQALGEKSDAIRILSKAWEVQKRLQYDEPPPFFYPIGETLARMYLEKRRLGSVKMAANLFREVLFTHPMTIRAVLGLWESLKFIDEMTGRQNSAAALDDLVSKVIKLNDTEISIEAM